MNQIMMDIDTDIQKVHIDPAKEKKRHDELIKWKNTIKTEANGIMTLFEEVEKQFQKYKDDIFSNNVTDDDIRYYLSDIRDAIRRFMIFFRDYPKPLNNMMIEFIKNTLSQYDDKIKNIISKVNEISSKFDIERKKKASTKIIYDIHSDEIDIDDEHQQFTLSDLGHDTAQVLRRIQHRDQEINELVASIQELNQLFMDISILVHDQGIVLDDIEFNVTNANENIESANVELVVAKKYQRSAYKKWCILFFILLIILIAGIIILVTLLKSNNLI